MRVKIVILFHNIVLLKYLNSLGADYCLMEYFQFVGENKSTVTQHLHDLNANPNPLETLEKWVHHKDFTKREVGFCAQWCLDNLCEFFVHDNSGFRSILVKCPGI